MPKIERPRPARTDFSDVSFPSNLSTGKAHVSESKKLSVEKPPLETVLGSSKETFAAFLRLQATNQALDSLPAIFAELRQKATQEPFRDTTTLVNSIYFLVSLGLYEENLTRLTDLVTAAERHQFVSADKAKTKETLDQRAYFRFYVETIISVSAQHIPSWLTISAQESTADTSFLSPKQELRRPLAHTFFRLAETYNEKRAKRRVDVNTFRELAKLIQVIGNTCEQKGMENTFVQVLLQACVTNPEVGDTYEAFLTDLKNREQITRDQYILLKEHCSKGLAVLQLIQGFFTRIVDLLMDDENPDQERARNIITYLDQYDVLQKNTGNASKHQFLRSLILHLILQDDLDRANYHSFVMSIQEKALDRDQNQNWAREYAGVIGVTNEALPYKHLIFSDQIFSLLFNPQHSYPNQNVQKLENSISHIIGTFNNGITLQVSTEFGTESGLQGEQHDTAIKLRRLSQTDYLIEGNIKLYREVAPSQKTGGDSDKDELNIEAIKSRFQIELINGQLNITIACVDETYKDHPDYLNAYVGHLASCLEFVISQLPQKQNLQQGGQEPVRVSSDSSVPKNPFEPRTARMANYKQTDSMPNTSNRRRTHKNTQLEDDILFTPPSLSEKLVKKYYPQELRLHPLLAKNDKKKGAAAELRKQLDLFIARYNSSPYDDLFDGRMMTTIKLAHGETVWRFKLSDDSGNRCIVVNTEKGAVIVLIENHDDAYVGGNDSLTDRIEQKLLYLEKNPHLHPYSN